MKLYFGIPIEFDRNVLENTIANKILVDKGYCCFVDSNLLVIANKHFPGIEDALNNSIINFCDGSYIAILASNIHKQKLKAYNGPEFFNKFIFQNETHCIIGNTPDVFEKIKGQISKKKLNPNLYHIPLPFLNVEQFDYENIADQINFLRPRYIWVSLGAPKQEIFMKKLLPHIDNGIMFGVGAALNYFSGEIIDIPKWAKKNNLIWLFRIFTEPAKQLKRNFNIIINIPAIYFKEIKKVKSLK